MSLNFGFAIIVLAASLQASPAFAQASRCMECRAQLPFGNCDAAAIANPPGGTVGFTGTVVQAEALQCATRLTVSVKRAVRFVLPAVIKIDVLPCLYWNGNTGEDINAAVMIVPSINGAYLARTCN
jgi:hypothetical protein